MNSQKLEVLVKYQQELENRVHTISEDISRLSACVKDENIDPDTSFDRLSNTCKEIKSIVHKMKSKYYEEK